MNTLIFIEWGMSFVTYDAYLSWLRSKYVEWSSVPYSLETKKKWKQKLAREWIEKWWVVYMPEMPCDLDAKYNEWKIVFEWVLSKISLDDEVVLVGHSLWGNFLLKYFSEVSHQDSVFVIPSEAEESLSSSSYENWINSFSKAKEKGMPTAWQKVWIIQIHLVAACVSEGDFTAPENYDVLRDLWNRVHIWHAEDDKVVPFATAKFLEKTLPEAKTHFFEPERWYGHFFPLTVFPELEEELFFY